MMADHEIKIIDDLISEYKPAKCLEWGSGGSTIYFPKRHACIKQWIAIEDLGRYPIFLNEHIDKEKVTMLWVPNDEWYTSVVEHNGKMFDFIFVDGVDEQRERCLEIAPLLLKDGGFILLHDSARRRYGKAIEKYENRSEKLCGGEKQLKDGDYAHRGLTKLWV